MPELGCGCQASCAAGDGCRTRAIAATLAHNARADRERPRRTRTKQSQEAQPPELGLLEREIKRVKNGRVLLIPASDQTAGHGTTGQARFWKQELAELLQRAPRRPQ